MQQPVPIELLLKQDRNLSSLPEIFIRLSELIDDENSTSGQIAMLIEADPSLATRILKMVNSAFYGFPQTIVSINQSIAILGRARLRQILIGVILGGVFVNLDNRIFPMEAYWQHSVKTGILSRLIGKRCGLSDQSEELFTAGLLHKIGRLILAQALPQLSMEVQQAIASGNETIYQAEQRILGYTHCKVGSAFMQQWGLPEILIEVAEHHHSPHWTGTLGQQVSIVYLASQLSQLAEEPEQEDVEQLLEGIEDWQSIGLSAEQLTDECIETDEQVYLVMESLGMR